MVTNTSTTNRLCKKYIIRKDRWNNYIVNLVVSDDIFQSIQHLWRNSLSYFGNEFQIAQIVPSPIIDETSIFFRCPDFTKKNHICNEFCIEDIRHNIDKLLFPVEFEKVIFEKQKEFIRPYRNFIIRY